MGDGDLEIGGHLKQQAHDDELGGADAEGPNSEGVEGFGGGLMWSLRLGFEEMHGRTLTLLFDLSILLI